MNKLQLSSKKIITWLCVNYGIFLLAFLVLGTLSSEYKGIIWINFFLDVAICVISLVLNIILFLQKHETSLFVKLVLLFHFAIPPLFFKYSSNSSSVRSRKLWFSMCRDSFPAFSSSSGAHCRAAMLRVSSPCRKGFAPPSVV